MTTAEALDLHMVELHAFHARRELCGLLERLASFQAADIKQARRLIVTAVGAIDRAAETLRPLLDQAPSPDGDPPF